MLPCWTDESGTERGFGQAGSSSCRGDLDPVSVDEDRSLPGLLKPTSDMIENHAVSRLPFWICCSVCVRARARSTGHNVQDKRCQNESLQAV